MSDVHQWIVWKHYYITSILLNNSFKMIIFLLIIGVLTLLWILLKPKNYWKGKNVKYGRIGTSNIEIFGMILGREHFTDLVKRVYNEIDDVRYIGSCHFNIPSLTLKSPELIKQICIKYFDHFLNHRSFVPEGVDELFSKNLFSLTGQNWKDMRSTLSPSFTSSKMRSMFVLICQNAELFVQYYLKKKENLIKIEFKDAFTRYTNDVIASTAFGVKVDSLKDKENEFFLMGKEATDVSGVLFKLKFLLFLSFPKLATLFQIKFFNEKVKNFFLNLVYDTIKLREEQHIKRPDMIGLLLEARKGKQIERTTNEIKDTSFAVVEEHLEMKTVKADLTDLDIASQMLIFFFGGFDTISTAMCFMAQELAENPDVQQKLIEEIDENRSKTGTAPSYETILNMTYLDMVVSETLRKWPSNPQTDRVVTKPYTIEPELPEETPIPLEVNVNIAIPIIAIHHDPKYWENPKKFDPERFSLENRKNIVPYTYLPFGVGPRNCIGSRFALLELKAVFFYLLSHFEIVRTEETQIPIQLSKKTFSLTPDGGFHLGLKLRNQ